MSRQRGLGRGFDSLIPTEVTADMPVEVRPVSEDAVIQVAPDKIVPNPHQPRTEFNDDELQGLANSIAQHGILHPPVVSDTGNGIYELIAGERRVRAARLAGLKAIPVIVRSFDEQQKLELALLENVQRAELNPIETAVAYRKLADEFNLTLDQIGARMGKAKSTVANAMRLLQLPPDAIEAVAKGKISEAHGRTLLAVNEPERQRQLLKHMLSDHWSVRQAEAFAKGEKTSPNRSKATTEKTPAEVEENVYNHVAQELADFLLARVSIVSQGEGGRVVIEYPNEHELQRIVGLVHPIEGDW